MEKTLEKLQHEARGISNTTAHFMWLAEKYFQEGNPEAARACLILLCKNCSNYEESIEWNGLTEKWQAYHHLVDGLVPSSVSVCSTAPRSPAECSVGTNHILSLHGDDLLFSLSEHLGELSGNGDALNCLNKWERTVYYIDELWGEVNSGGFDSYLYHHGSHFEKAYHALETISACGVLEILGAVQEKFPKKRIPKTEESLQNTMDVMEEQGIDFESEDELFYSSGEHELLKCLLLYIKKNKVHFR